MPAGTLCANDDETKHWAKFRLRGSQENVSWSCRIKPWRRKLRWVPAQKEAEGRLSCRHPRRLILKFLTARGAGRSPRWRSCAFSKSDQAAGTGEIGAILRRHGLYSSALGEGAAAGGGNPGRADTGEARAEIAPGQSAGHRTGLCAKGKRPAPAPSGAGRGNHRRPKKLADLLGIQLAPIAPEIVRDNTP